MQRTQDPATDSTPGIASPSPWRVTKVEATSDFRFEVTFVDATKGSVDMRNFLASEQVVGTLFEPLRNPGFFGQLRVERGVVSWPNGADLAPDAMYDAIIEHGIWVVD